MSLVKICGLKNEESVKAAIEGGASFIGFVFFPESPRYIEIEEAAHLSHLIPDTTEIVGLFVEASDEDIQKVLSRVPLTLLQLHGLESPERVSEIKEKFKIPIIKALPISEPSDLEYVDSYKTVADWLLFDTKLSDGSSGGAGVSFDWSLLSNVRTMIPWFLAGGLTPENIGSAIEILNPPAVDVSSGVESVRGVKNPNKIRIFLKNTR